MENHLSMEGSNLENEAQAVHHMETVQMDEHMKAMWAGQSNVLVAVRVRPILSHDRVAKSCVRVLDSKVIVIMDPQHDKGDVLRANRSREKQYAFDYAFEQRSSQEATYHHTTKFLIHGVLDGFSATVFAYGQTGSGKTHTMIGTHENPGIMVRVMSDLFKYSASQASKLGAGVYFKVTVNFLEVYNENIRDLLGENNNPDEYLDLREDPIKGAVVAGITEVEVHNSKEIMQLLHRGNAKRSQAATAANEVSSRSHAVLQVAVDSRDRAPGVAESIKVGKLSLIDLAGSERAANTQNRGARLVEGANINRSLLALGNCINALDTSRGKGTFVPYRDSKLTRLLKDSLGGNCRTIMIANISPAESSFEETINTLKYANRAKNIKTTVKRNVLNVNYHISEYVDLINNLRSEIQVLKGQMETGPNITPSYVPNSAHNGNSESNQAVNGNAPLPILVDSKFTSDLEPHLNLNSFTATPSDAIRSNLRSGGHSRGRAGTATTGKDRELVNSMRQMVVSNFQERMQLRRSLIELEDQNVQNSIEISKRELMVVNWTEHNPNGKEFVNDDGKPLPQSSAEFSSHIIVNATPQVASAWRECEQLRKAVMKNNSMKRSIAKRLRHNEREAQRVRDDLGNKITGEDRRELMELQYQVGRLELENMELEQHRIVHESILKGKDLVIQKLKLQVAVRDKLIQRQQTVLKEAEMDDAVGYSSLALFEDSLLGLRDLSDEGADMSVERVLNHPNSPPRTVTSMGREQAKKLQMISPRGVESQSKDHSTFNNTHASIESRTSYQDYNLSTEIPSGPRITRGDDHPVDYGGNKFENVLGISEPFDKGFSEGDWTKIEGNEVELSDSYKVITTQESDKLISGVQNKEMSSSSIKHNPSTPPKEIIKVPVSPVTSSNKLSVNNRSSIKAASVDKLPAAGQEKHNNSSSSTGQISALPTGNIENKSNNRNTKETPIKTKTNSRGGLGLTSSVPAVFDSPSVGALRDGVIEMPDSSLKGSSPSNYQQVYQVAFNNNVSSENVESRDKDRFSARGGRNTQGSVTKKSPREKQKNNYLSDNNDNSPTTSPRNSNASPRSGGMRTNQSPDHSDRLIYGHELDEKSVETVISEVSQNSYVRDKNSVNMHNSPRSLPKSSNRKVGSSRKENDKDERIRKVGKPLNLEENEKRGRQKPNSTNVYPNNGNAKKPIDVNQLQQHQARMRAFRDTENKNNTIGRNRDRYMSRDRASDSSVEQSNGSSRKRAQLQRLRNGSKTQRANNINRVRESVLKEQQQYHSMHQQMQQMQEMQARQQQQLLVQRGNYSKAEPRYNQNHSSENQNKNSNPTSSKENYSNPYLQGNPQVNYRQQIPKGGSGSFAAPHGPPGTPPNKGQGRRARQFKGQGKNGVSDRRAGSIERKNQIGQSVDGPQPLRAKNAEKNRDIERKGIQKSLREMSNIK